MRKDIGKCFQYIVNFCIRRFSALLTVTLLFLTSVFIFLVFKNIQYPLLWNDEAETAVYAERILSYGYPKAYDGKNILNLCEFEKRNLCVGQRLDAYVFQPWMQFYFAGIGTLLAHATADIYTKTMLVRAPFAFIGFLGLTMFGLMIGKLFRLHKHKLTFILLFILHESTSVFLFLHLRQARSYPITLFISALIIYLYINHNILNKVSFRTYNVLVITLLFLLFHLFYPAYIIFIVTFVIHTFLTYITTKKRTFIIKSLIPYCISVVTILPSLWFFNIIPIVFQAKESFNYSPVTYFTILDKIIYFFSIYEFLLPVFFLKAIIAFCFVFSPYLRKDIIDSLQNKVSLFLTLLFIVYIIIIPYSPYFYFRYTLLLQPVLTIIFLLDLYVVIQIYKKLKRPIKTNIMLPSLLILAISFTPSLSTKLVLLKYYFQEINTPYKGPLDYVIPYIKTHYKNTEDLVIATNYEEPSYIYYLGSKIIIGFTGINLEEDKKMTPDIVILRKFVTSNSNIIKDLISDGNYKKTSFPVFDYPVNNIPELVLFPSHLFRTRYTTDPNKMLEIYEKIK